uniref:Uncharacterized protein n=1 Tax=Lepeophtheirus salmonis TaxID=72036 RepID=A0A0K2UVT1_LEPSM
MGKKKKSITFNQTKSSAIVFSKAYKLRSKYIPQLEMDGKVMEYATYMKYLGLTFDKELARTKHLKKSLQVLLDMEYGQGNHGTKMGAHFRQGSLVV